MDEFKKLLIKYDSGILYKSLENEHDPNGHSFPITLPRKKLILPNSKDSDPFGWAAKCIEEFRNHRPYILIPGTSFDLYGTRHGRGGGWYDRFLSKVPAEWLRIGVADKSQISKTRLEKKDWDQSVNWILVFDKSTWKAHLCEMPESDRRPMLGKHQFYH